MKFEMLSLIKQVTLIVDLAQLHTHLDKYTCKKPADPVLIGTGLSLPISYVRLGNTARFITIPSTKNDIGNHEMPEHDLAFVYPEESRKYVILSVVIDSRIDPNTIFDKFGLMANMAFAPPFDVSFAKGAKYIRAIETLNNTNHDISNTLKKLSCAARKIENIPENILDLYYVNYAVVNKLSAISDVLSMYDKSSVPETRLGYNTSVLYNHRTITAYLPNTSNIHRHNLVIDLGYAGDDKINVGYSIGNGAPVTFAIVTPLNYPEPEMFAKEVLNLIIEAVRGSDDHAVLENKLVYFIETYEKALPNMVRRLTSISGKEV